MRTVGMEPAQWAEMYVSLLEYGVYLFRQGAPPKHIRWLLNTLVPPVAAAADRPEYLTALEAELKEALGVRERALAAATN